MIAGWTAVIVNYNGAGFLEACLHALERVRPRPHDVIVVDNASSDDSLQEVHGFPRVQALPQHHNLGFAGGANVGLRAVETDLALLLNPDVELAPDAGAALGAAFAADPLLGAAGALLFYPESDLIQHAGGVIERPLMTTRHLAYREPVDDRVTLARDVDFVTGGAMGLRMRAFRETGGFDEAFSPVYYEDVDLCVRLRAAGWRVRLVPDLCATHHEGVTLQQSETYFRHLHRNRIRFALKHLTPAELRDEFVPAEYARLRHELWTRHEDSWAERSGADAVLAVAGGAAGAASWSRAPLLYGPPPAALEESVAELCAVWDLPLRRPGPLGWLRATLGAIAGVRGLAAAQREVNAALLRAVERQDKLNREHTAQLLLLALDLSLMARPRVVERDDPPAE